MMLGDHRQNPGRPGEQSFIILKKINITIIIALLLGAKHSPKIYILNLKKQLYEVDTVTHFTNENTETQEVCITKPRSKI